MWKDDHERSVRNVVLKFKTTHILVRHKISFASSLLLDFQMKKKTRPWWLVACFLPPRPGVHTGPRDTWAGF